jgi:Bacterial regulatory proteins, luxR family
VVGRCVASGGADCRTASSAARGRVPRTDRALVVSEATVKTHVGNILAKLDLRNRVQAVIFGYDIGLVR